VSFPSCDRPAQLFHHTCGVFLHFVTIRRPFFLRPFARVSPLLHGIIASDEVISPALLVNRRSSFAGLSCQPFRSSVFSPSNDHAEFPTLVCGDPHNGSPSPPLFRCLYPPFENVARLLTDRPIYMLLVPACEAVMSLSSFFTFPCLWSGPLEWRRTSS